MNTAFSISRSGMAAAQRSLDASAQNIANQGVAGFRRQQVDLRSVDGGGVDAGVTTADRPGDDLVADMVQQKVALYAFKANARVLKTQDEVLGSLLDTTA